MCKQGIINIDTEEPYKFVCFYLFSGLTKLTSSNFTCTSSSNQNAEYTCDKLYDGDGTTGWRTQSGKGNHSWVDIQFNRVIRINQIEILQAKHGLFRKIILFFSNGQTQVMTLSDVSLKWNSVRIIPPVDTNGLWLFAMEYYTPENLDTLVYRFQEIRLNGRGFSSGTIIFIIYTLYIINIYNEDLFQ